MSPIFQELVTSIELGLYVEKASGPTVKTRLYLPFHECFVSKNEDGEALGEFMLIFQLCKTVRLSKFGPYLSICRSSDFTNFLLIAD